MPLFAKAKDRFLKGEIDLLTAPIKALLKSGVPASLSVADTLADIPAGERVKIEDLVNSQLVPGLDPEELWWTADDVNFTSVTGSVVTQIILYVQGPSEALSPLIWARNAAFTPNGNNILAVWGSNIFSHVCKGGNDWYFQGKLDLFQAKTDFSANDIHTVLVDSTYTLDLINHVELRDIPISTRVGDVSGYSLAGKLVGIADGLQGGVFDADDVIIPALTGNDIVAVALIKFLSATPEDSPLIGYITEGLNFPLTPDGSLTGVVWSDAEGRIIKL